jgi:hypothetical protein
MNIFIRDILTLVLEIILSAFVLNYFGKFKAKKMHLLKTSEEKHNMKLTLATIILSISSIIIHVTFMVVTFLFVFGTSITQATLAVVLNLFTLVKHSSNFFIFYYFNENFRNTLSGLLKRLNGSVGPPRSI